MLDKELEQINKAYSLLNNAAINMLIMDYVIAKRSILKIM